MKESRKQRPAVRRTRTVAIIPPGKVYHALRQLPFLQGADVHGSLGFLAKGIENDLPGYTRKEVTHDQDLMLQVRNCFNVGVMPGSCYSIFLGPNGSGTLSYARGDGIDDKANGLPLHNGDLAHIGAVVGESRIHQVSLNITGRHAFERFRECLIPGLERGRYIPSGIELNVYEKETNPAEDDRMPDLGLRLQDEGLVVGYHGRPGSSYSRHVRRALTERVHV